MPKALSEHVSLAVKDLYSTLKVLKTHLSGLVQTGFTGANPQDATEIDDLIAQIENNGLQTLVPTENNPPATAVYRLMGEVHKVEQNLTRVRELMLRYAPDPQTLYASNLTRSSAMSSATITEILKTQRVMEVYVTQSCNALSGEELYEAAVSQMDLKDVDAILALESGVPEGNLGFYALVLQRTIDQNISSRDRVSRIMIHIEQLKSSALGPAHNRKAYTLTQVPLFQQLVQTFRLIPSEPSKPLHLLLQELCPELGQLKPLSVDSPPDLHKELTKIAGSLTTQSGFIVWRKLSSFQHHFRILSDKDYLRDTLGEITLTEGVSPKYVAATDTLSDMEIDRKTRKAGDYLLTVEGERFWIILETLDGSNFHCLRPWRGPSPMIPKYWFSGLIPPGKTLSQIAKHVNVEVVPSPRVENYNEILEEEVLKHLRTPFVSLQQMTRDESMREDLYWKNLRTAIVKKSMVDFRAMGLEKDKPDKFLAHLHRVREDYFAQLVQHIVERIEGFDAVKLSADAMLWARRELNLSGVQQLDKLKSSLAKTAESTYQDMRKLPKNTSRGLDLLWPEVLEETLTRFINRRSGLYIILDNKSEVLKTTLLT